MMIYWWSTISFSYKWNTVHSCLYFFLILYAKPLRCRPFHITTGRCVKNRIHVVRSNVKGHGQKSSVTLSFVQVVVEMKKKEGIWIKIPCIDNCGSCTFDDFCQVMAPVKCPDPVTKAGISCHCPLTQVN
jgi:hypothetical protein